MASDQEELRRLVELFKDCAEDCEFDADSRSQAYPGEIDRRQVAIGEAEGKAAAYEDAWRRLEGLLEVDDGE